MTEHSSEKALSEREFERFFEAATEIGGRMGRECRFVAIAGGRLGLRAGELCHLTEDWINWRKSQIEIPRHDPCTKGRDGGVCGYCVSRAKSRVECHDPDDGEEQITMEEALDERWNPKTEDGARVVPFDFDPVVEQEVNKFFFDYDGFEYSRSAVNRRVDRTLEHTAMPTSKTHPHGLRATAATYHAFSGLSAAGLQGLFGWADIETANKYLRKSGGATRRALEETYGD